MRNKTLLTILVLAAIAAAVIAVLWLRRGIAPQPPAEEEPYDRMKSPEYQKILEFERAEQKRTMGEIARARQNLEEAKEAKLEPEVVKELEDAVAAAEKELELEQERMRANLRRELWKEQNPEKVKVVDSYRAKQAEIMAKLDEARKRLDDAVAAGAPAEEVAALQNEVNLFGQKLTECQIESEKALRNLRNK